MPGYITAADILISFNGIIITCGTVFVPWVFYFGEDFIMKTNKNIAMRISAISIIINVILSIFKFIAGIVGNSGAMISDAVHSASDIFSTFIVIIGINIAGKKSDSDHPYGHERFESVASVILAVILAVTGLGIGYDGIMKIIQGNYEALETPGLLPLIAAVVSIAVKEWMYWFTRAGAKKINSDALMADAWHHRSDALSSIGSFAGILGARLGFPVLDPVASVIICLFILKAAVDIFKNSVDKLVDKSCCDDVVESFRQAVLEQGGVIQVDEIRTRIFGSGIYVDIEIAADGNLTLNESHEIAENVHDMIENTFSDVRHCMVHVNPYNILS